MILAEPPLNYKDGTHEREWMRFKWWLWEALWSKKVLLPFRVLLWRREQEHLIKKNDLEMGKWDVMGKWEAENGHTTRVPKLIWDIFCSTTSPTSFARCPFKGGGRGGKWKAKKNGHDGLNHYMLANPLITSLSLFFQFFPVESFSFNFWLHFWRRPSFSLFLVRVPPIQSSQCVSPCAPIHIDIDAQYFT